MLSRKNETTISDVTFIAASFESARNILNSICCFHRILFIFFILVEEGHEMSYFAVRKIG